MDLTKLLSNVTNKIDVDEIVVFPKEYYENTDIVELKPVHVMGTIHKNYNDEIILNLDADGNMVLEDAISLEPVLYPFQVHLEDEVIENAKINEKSLDIMEVLWQNIVLEIPLKYTKVEDVHSYHGDGWKVISEEDARQRENPFQDLKNKLGEE